MGALCHEGKAVLPLLCKLPRFFLLALSQLNLKDICLKSCKNI